MARYEPGECSCAQLCSRVASHTNVCCCVCMCASGALRTCWHVHLMPACHASVVAAMPCIHHPCMCHHMPLDRLLLLCSVKVCEFVSVMCAAAMYFTPVRCVFQPAASSTRWEPLCTLRGLSSVYMYTLAACYKVGRCPLCTFYVEGECARSFGWFQGVPTRPCVQHPAPPPLRVFLVTCKAHPAPNAMVGNVMTALRGSAAGLMGCSQSRAT
jgi:hypothetical protein